MSTQNTRYRKYINLFSFESNFKNTAAIQILAKTNHVEQSRAIDVLETLNVLRDQASADGCDPLSKGFRFKTPL
jgi:hypothetical protein